MTPVSTLPPILVRNTWLGGGGGWGGWCGGNNPVTKTQRPGLVAALHYSEPEGTHYLICDPSLHHNYHQQRRKDKDKDKEKDTKTSGDIMLNACIL